MSQKFYNISTDTSQADAAIPIVASSIGKSKQDSAWKDKLVSMLCYPIK
jgi:hypothetical protein